MDSAVRIIENIPLSELLSHLNRGVLFRSRWKLSIEEGEKELERMLAEYDLSQLNVKAVYGYFPKETVQDFSVSVSYVQKIYPLFAVTTGGEGAEIAKKIFSEDRYFDYFLFNGLLSELAESAAGYVNEKVKNELGIVKTKRFSPGYPAWPDISDQQKLLDILTAQNIGITLTTSFQLVPEHSITGIIVFQDIKILKKQD